MVNRYDFVDILIGRDFNMCSGKDVGEFRSVRVLVFRFVIVSWVLGFYY